MRINLKSGFFLLIVWIFGISLFFFATKSTSSDLYANTSPCEELKYEYVCCGPQCEVNGETKNYCLGEGGQYSCCYNNCDPELEPM